MTKLQEGLAKNANWPAEMYVTQEWQGTRGGGSSKVTQRRENKGSSGD